MQECLETIKKKVPNVKSDGRAQDLPLCLHSGVQWLLTAKWDGAGGSLESRVLDAVVKEDLPSGCSGEQAGCWRSWSH